MENNEENGNNNVQPKESKREKFVRLANSRTRKAVKQIEVISNLFKGNYEFSVDDWNKIRGAIDKELDRIDGILTKKGGLKELFSLE